MAGRRRGSARDLLCDGARRARRQRTMTSLRPCPSWHGHAHGVPALEMTKWFDTNYHYMVPELRKDQTFSLASRKPIEEYEEAKALGYQTRPVLVGPGHVPEARQEQGRRFRSAVAARPAAAGLHRSAARTRCQQARNGCSSTSPASVLDLDVAAQRRAARAPTQTSPRRVPQHRRSCWRAISAALGDNRDTALSLSGRRAAHLDLVARAGPARRRSQEAPKDRVLSLGVIDGRNIWRADLAGILDRLEPVVSQARQLIASRSRRPVRCCMSRSISALETDLDPEAQELARLSRCRRSRNWRRSAPALARGRGCGQGRARRPRMTAAAARKASPQIHDAAVAARMRTASTPRCAAAPAALPSAPSVQRARFNLPAFPTTTIGSFPQTDRRPQRARRARARAP